MNFSKSNQMLLAIFVILLGFVGVYFLSGFVEKNRPPMPRGYEDEDLIFKGSKLKGFTLGLDGLIADWYWMQSLQYLGGKFAANPDANINVNNLREFDPKLLYPLLDNSTNFDPQFLGVYEYGAVVLPAVDSVQAVKLTEKGIANNPNEWRLYNQLGYIYWKSKDYEKASNAYLKASQMEGSSPIMKTMVARMKSDAGSRETAREIYQQIFDEARDSQTKQVAETQLSKIDALVEIDAVNSVLQEFKNNHNRCVSDLREVLPFLAKIKLPNEKDFSVDNSKNLVDPSGAPYLLNKESCKIEFDKGKTKLPLD